VRKLKTKVKTKNHPKASDSRYMWDIAAIEGRKEMMKMMKRGKESKRV